MSAEINHPNPRKRLIQNAFFSSLGWFLPIVLTLAATPIIVKGLGYEQYGIYALFLGFISYSFTFGVGRAVTKYVAEYRRSGEIEKISQIVSVSFWLSIVLCAAVSFFIILFSEPIIESVLQIDRQSHEAAAKALLIACGTIGFLMIGQVFQGILQGIHRFDRISLLVTISGVVLTAGNIFWVLNGFGFLVLIMWNLLVTAINGVFYFYFARKFLPDLRINFVFSREIVRLVFLYGSGVFGYQIFANALLIFERSWITRSLGAENLTFYVVPMTLGLYMHAFISSVVLVIFPVISELQNDREKLLRLYQRATKIVISTVVLITLTLICSGRTLLTLWISRDFAEKSSSVLPLLAASFCIISVLSIVWQLAEGFGHPRFNAVISFFWLAVSVPVMIWLISPAGIFGVGIGRFTGHLITLPFIFVGEKKFLGEIQWGFWKKTSLTIGLAATAAVIVEFLIFEYFETNWLVFLAGGFCGAAVYASVLWLVNFWTDEEKNLFRNYIFRQQL